MAQVNFNYRVDMSTIDPPTDPSGYIVAYDLDGILKQKDYNGVVTPIGINPPYLFYNLNTSIFATNSTSAIYRQGSINIGSGTATNGRFVVSSSGGTVSLIVDELGSVYNSGAGNWIDNTAFGYNSLKSNIPNSSPFSFDGKYNSAFGASSLLSNTTGYYNSAFGYYSLFSTSVSVANSAFGYYSLYSNSTGSSNSAFGVYSLQSNIIGSNNSAFGLNSLGANTTGSNNSVIGYYSLASNTTGSRNVAIGYQAGSFPSDSILGTTNSNNSIFIGYETKPLSSNNTNQIVIGYESIGNGSNTVTLGNNDIIKTILKGNIGVGLTAPSTKLHVYATQSGAFRLEDGTQGAGYFLVSDANGVGSWSAVSSISISGSASYIPKFTGTSSLDNSNFVDYGTSGRYSYSSNYVEFISGANVFLRLTRSQSSMDFALGNPGIAQSGVITSYNSYGLDIISQGYLAFSSGSSYSEVLRITSSGNVGIGLTAPSTTLHVYATQSGAFRLQDGTQANGYILTSDSNGVGTWTASTTVAIITTTSSITTNTLDNSGFNQIGRCVIIDNGTYSISITVDATSGFSSTYLKHGTASISFVQGSGRTLVQVDGTLNLNGTVGSTATIISYGTTDYLRINNA